MGKAYKNFWSLNTDEAVATGILRDEIEKGMEVFMPLNAQLKDIDLVVMNLKNKKSITLQIKGSRAYEPRKSETKKYGDGSACWFFFDKKVIDDSKADYFLFLLYVLTEDCEKGRRLIEPHTITIQTNKLKELCSKNKNQLKDRYNFSIWVNPKKKEAFDALDKSKIYSLSEYLDKKGFENLNKNLL